MTTFLADERDALRRRARKARLALSSDMRTDFSQQICAHIIEQSWWKDAHTVALYVPVGSEVDVWPLVSLGLGQGRSVVIPRIVGDGLTGDRLMTFDAVGSDDRSLLSVGPHSIPKTATPDPVSSADISLMLVPAVAIDAAGNRLGGGAGYYDRWLAEARLAASCPHALATVFATQLVGPADHIPTEPHDQPVDAVVTERGFTRFAP